MYSLLILGSLLIFILTENTFLHFSRTARRAFWYGLSCAVGVWLVRWLQTVEGLGMVWVFLSAVLAASVVEDEVAKKTGLTPLNIEATQRLRGVYRTPEAQGKAERIMDIVGSITKGKGYTAGTKQLVSRVSGTTRRLQSSLHTVLVTSSSRELNYILCAVNVAALVEVARNATVEMLVGDRLEDLSTVARAALVDGVQKLGMRYRPQRQLWVRDVMVHTTGLDLTHFKAYIDDGGDYHTMYKLVYNDLQGPVQQQVLQHLQRQGAAVLKELQDQGPGAPPGAVLKILSDIDDTVFSSGGSFPAGVDTRYPRKCYYPGALALFAALDRCFAKQYAENFRGMAKGHPELELEPPPEDSPDPTPSPPIVVPAPPVHRTFSFSLLTRALTQHAGSGNLDSSLMAMGSSPPVRSLMGDLMTPREMAAYPEGASPRAAAWAEVRAAAPPGAHHQEGSNLVFLSARPESYKGLTESESYRKYFQPLVLRGDLDTSPTMLLGSLDSGPRALFKLLTGRWMLPHDDPNPKTAAAALYQTLAAKKLSRFREYAAIYPEAAFLYVGDNGQGDVLCAEILYSSARQAASLRPSQLLASYIHRVAPLASSLSMLKSFKATKADWIAAWQQRNIYFHRSHVGMAVQARSMGLLDNEGLHCVASSAVSDFRRIVGRYAGRQAGRHLDTARKHLNADLDAANALLPDHMYVEPVAGVAVATVVPGLTKKEAEAVDEVELDGQASPAASTEVAAMAFAGGGIQ